MIKVVAHLLCLLLVISFTTILHAKTLDQKKEDLKKIYKAGGISKVEYEKGKEFLKNLENKDKKKKQNQKFSLGHKKKKNSKKNNKEEKEEEINLKKIEELGQIVKFDKSYYPESMQKEFRGSINSFKVRSRKL